MHASAIVNEPNEPLRTGTGALCPESQADGVPCPTLDRDCRTCANASPELRRRPGKMPRNGDDDFPPVAPAS